MRLRLTRCILVVLGWAVSASGVPLAQAAAPAPPRNSARAAEEAARAFIQATDNGDPARIRPLVTRMAWKNFFGKDLSVWTDILNARTAVGRAQIRQGHAVVPVVQQHGRVVQRQRVKLRRENGNWRVYALWIAGTKRERAATVDFEHPDFSARKRKAVRRRG